MALSKVLSSSASRNSDLSRLSSSKSQSSNNDNIGSMNVDGILRTTYAGGNTNSDSTLVDAEVTFAGTDGSEIPRQQSISSGRRTVEDVWKEIVGGRKVCKEEPLDEVMTLEDFLAKADAVDKVQDVKVPVLPPSLLAAEVSGGVHAFDMVPLSPFGSQSAEVSATGFGNGVEVGGGRGKRRAVLEPLDKVAQQRQRRMIKNRESAARSRERKQAYQVELESMAVKLEEENEQLLREKAEQTKERYKQLMEKIIPVVEKRRPLRIHRRIQSSQW